MKKNFLKWLFIYRIHFLVWGIFIIYETVIVGLVFGVYGKPLTYAIHYIIILVLFYINSNILLPWALKNTKVAIWRLPLILFAQISAYVLSSYAGDILLLQMGFFAHSKTIQLNTPYILKTIYRALYFTGMSTGFYYLLTFFKQKKISDELEQQRLNDIILRQKTEQELSKAQNAFLKAQINPHFLFNTLDFIYHNITISPESAGDAIITLSEIMRYAVDANKMEDFIFLSDEITQVESLLHLYQLRKAGDQTIDFEHSEEIIGLRFIPLVLPTLVENMFKHGQISMAHKATISLYVEGGLFYIATSNKSSQALVVQGLNSGLKNIENRLKYAFGDNVAFSCFLDQQGCFQLKLSVPIDQMRSPVLTTKV